MKFTRMWTETTHYCQDEEGYHYRRDPDGTWYYGGQTAPFWGEEERPEEIADLEAAFIDQISISDLIRIGFQFRRATNNMWQNTYWEYSKGGAWEFADDKLSTRLEARWQKGFSTLQQPSSTPDQDPA